MADLRKDFWTIMSGIADKDTMVLTGDLGYSFVDGFKEQHPDKFINAGIAEQNMVGVGAGLALAGKKPYLYSGAIFLAVRALEQIRDDIAYPNLNVKLIGTGASGFLGHTHNFEGTENIDDLIKNLPNIKLVKPQTPGELLTALLTPGPYFIKL